MGSMMTMYAIGSVFFIEFSVIFIWYQVLSPIVVELNKLNSRVLVLDRVILKNIRDKDYRRAQKMFKVSFP